MSFKCILITTAVFVLGVAVSVTAVQASDLSPMENLGKKLFFDKISDPSWMSCATCHHPDVGWTGPIAGINRKGTVYRGAVPKRFGNRKPPSAAYATFSPIFHYDDVESLFIGGNFWDGRATGERLGNPAADQALGPFLNPVEQNNASKQSVLVQVADSKYATLWEQVWGEPISYETAAEIEMNYDRIGLAIAAYEASSEVNQFSSKYDYYLEGLVDLTEQEEWGLELFEGKAMCSACHPSEPGAGGEPPLFTDFSFDNLGVPKNPENPFYDMDKVFLDDGSPINPLGAAWIDPGLGGFLQTSPEWEDLAAENMGKHKVPTLRNVDKRFGAGFTKAYAHNGFFKSLKEIVHFYNTRDVEAWPAPEEPANVNTDELGDLGLTDAEEAAIVAFMKTLSDGYTLPVVKTIASAQQSPTSYNLAQNYPNPFNPWTDIQYDIPQDGHVTLKVYNVLGAEVATLVDAYQTANSYSVRWDASDLASGVYFCTIDAGNVRKSIKMLLMK
jgi:cytochrome c peroxidase